MEVVQLKTANGDWNGKVHAEIIEVLETWLADAKAGKYEAIAICGIEKDGSVDTNVPTHNEHITLVGALAILLSKTIALGIEG